MGRFLNNDDVIWLKNMDADRNTIALLRQLPASTRLKLEIEGHRGEWERMADGKDGRPTYGLKPVGQTVEFWKSMKPKRGTFLEFRIADPRDNYLSAMQTMLSEWESKEDESAFDDL